MTGTGTQTDPYYPTNWDEFVIAISQRGVYIECPENGVWDMNEMLPEGLKSNVIWSDNTVHGNGLTINNLYFNGGAVGFHGNGNDRSTYADIYNLNFSNMATSGSCSVMFYPNDSSAYFRNCKFSGSITSGVLVGTNVYFGRICFTHDNEKSCSLNFKLLGNGNLGGNIIFEYCYINLDGDTTKNFANVDSNFNKCYIAGKCPWNQFTINGIDNILDIDIPEGTILPTLHTTHSGVTTSVLNIDKMHGSYTIDSNPDYKYIEATEAQLSDAAYLQSKGFSIAGG